RVDAIGYYYYNRAYYLSYQNYVQYRNYLYYRNRYYTNYNYYYSSNSGSNSPPLRDKFNVGVTGRLIGALICAVLFVVLIACVCYRRRQRTALLAKRSIPETNAATTDHVTTAVDGEFHNETSGGKLDHVTTAADGQSHNEPRDTSNHATNASDVEFHHETADTSDQETAATDKMDHIKLNDTTNHAVTSSNGVALNERDVTKGGTDDHDDYGGYYDDDGTEFAAIIAGVTGGICILIPFAIVCWYHKCAKRPGRVVNPTAVPTVTQTQFGGTYGNNFSYNIPTQLGTQFTYGQQQQSQPNPYQQQSQPDQYNGAVAGVVIGSFMSAILITVIIVICIKHHNKTSGIRGQVIHPHLQTISTSITFEQSYTTTFQEPPPYQQIADFCSLPPPYPGNSVLHSNTTLSDTDQIPPIYQK
ncbi:Hypothetical predicted protein, partial [Mytilus galloprovincialis]